MEVSEMIQAMSNVDEQRLFDKALEKVFPFIVELLKEQLKEGETGDGYLPDYRSNSYANWKEKYVPTYNVYPTTDLRVTGDLYEGIFVEDALLAIEIKSRDRKSDRLESKYGQRIYVLNKNSMDKLKPRLLEEMTTMYREQIKI